ncbi:MAG: 50S ribosomal protein L17 [Kiritimatiellae bacterium]|jgi:large subunit ribosomal protein L17|nr:50S ribosomal protein L17 [Kiritimatiellia bacterium]
MRHRKSTKRLGRSSSHHKALLASLSCGLIKQKKIKTTLMKAKLAKSFSEKMVTLGKADTLASRRKAIAKLRQEDAVKILFSEIAPTFKDRDGGYTRIVKLGRRRSDGSEMAILEWVEDTSVAVAAE